MSRPDAGIPDPRRGRIGGRRGIAAPYPEGRVRGSCQFRRRYYFNGSIDQILEKFYPQNYTDITFIIFNLFISTHLNGSTSIDRLAYMAWKET